MARPQQDIIETFMSITGASEAIAFQKLEEHGGNLNQAINAHFNEEDRATIHPVLAPQDDFMAIDDPNQEESQGPSQSLPSATGNLNPIASIDPKSGPSFSDRGGTAEVTGHAPQVSIPGEVEEVPIRFKDGTGQSGHSGLNPSVKDATGSAHAHEPEDNGIVIIDDEEDENLSITPAALSAHPIERANEVDERRPGISVPQLDNAIIDNGDDIEEEMLRAAIEASKREVDGGYSDQQFGIPFDTSGSRFVPGSSHSDDFEFARAVSMSLKTAQQEKALREKVGSVGTEQHGVSQSSDVEESGKLAAESERQGFSLPNMQAPSQVMVEEGNSSVQEEAEDVEEQPLVRHRSRRISFGASSDAMESAAVVDEMVDSLPSSPIPHDITNYPQPNGDAFHSDEWGGISSEEHDDAVMLEAAIFGGIPEENAYHHRFAYPLHDARQTGLERNAGLYPRPAPRPPSPTLVEQRLLREQQDDEYLAALKADTEKELKAREEAEIRRLEEAAAREAFLQEERNREEETRRKLLEAEEFERRLAEKEASLPHEPATEDETAITLLVRMPDGSRRGRRFLKSDKLQFLFDFIDIGRGVKPGTYRLVRPYPRRAFSDLDSGLSLNDLGLSSKQEALFLELI